MRLQKTGTILLLITSLTQFFGCTYLSRSLPPPASPQNGSATLRASGTGLFEDVAASAGVRFVHATGGTGKFYFIESTPAGCAFFDYDNDGYLDILLIQSGPSEASLQGKERPHCALYHNNGNGTFTDVTAGSGLDKDLGYGHGVAVGDYDNDGYDDLFITAFGKNTLLHNEHGTGKFTDVTQKMGLDKLHSTGYATSAAFGDYDNDGRLDLYVCYYCPWHWDTNKPCHNPQGRIDYCSPEIYDPDVHVLYHNEGNRFRDVSVAAGITKAKGHGLAVAFVDYDEDGKQDIFVANDLTSTMLWHNNGDGTFTDVAGMAGCSYSEGGIKMAAMGVGVADYDHSGHDSLFISNFANLPNTLFKNMGNGLFQDVSMPSGVALPHMKFLTFGCEFLDYDADGWPDLITANGHVQMYVDTLGNGTTYKERKQLYHNTGNGTFREISDPAQLGDLNVPTVARGLAVGDFDNDGRLDILVNNQNGPAQLLHNRDPSGNHWVRFKMIGTKSNRDGLHTRLMLTANGMQQTASVRAGSSYLSHSDTRVYFGLGKASRAEKVEIHWPSGTRETLKDVEGDQDYLVTEGKGITGKLPRKVARSQ
jgi:hypothetical protein